MAGKIQLYRRWGKIDASQAACESGRDRVTECFTYSIKPLQGNGRVKEGVVSLRRFRLDQQVYFWEDGSGKVYDVVPKLG